MSNDPCFNMNLKNAAQAYHELGIPVVPFRVWQENGQYEKKPHVDAWAKWETEPQTDDEFGSLDLDGANGIGVILGTKAKNGLYLSVIDHDTKGKMSDEAKAKGAELLREFPTTQTQKSANKGIHLVYWSRTKPETDGTFHDSLALELLGERKLCVMCPSLGYMSVNDNSPTEVENIEETFYSVLRKHGYKHNEETETQNQLDAYGFQLEKIVDLEKLNKISPDEYQGSHPFHDSTTEKNFHVNTRTNQWFCFRHNSGGGALQYLAMKEGIIKCEQAKKGALRGGKFKQVLQLAVSQGLLDEKILTQSEINPIILAKDIKEDYAFIVDRESNILYYYDEKEGIYSDRTEQLIKREIVKRLDENTKVRYYTEIENFITHSAPLVDMNLSPELIGVQNGVLNIFTKELKPFSPEFYLTQKLEVAYDPKAQHPAITKFLTEVLPDEKQRQIIQEYVGYALYRKITHHVCLLFVGTGRNGKSKLLELITRLLGEDNVTDQTIQNLCYNRFSLAELHHKLANISADLPSKELANTGIFKMITGGDRLPGERKHKDPFYFGNYAKLMFSCNRIPPIPETEACLAYYIRFKIVEFKQKFLGKDADKRIMDKLTTPEELSGFLNFALEGLRRLEENKDFTESMTQDETEKAYVKLSNSAQAFITEMIKVTDEHTDFCFADVLYRSFITYCHGEKIQTVPKAAFTKTMQEFCNGAERTKIRPDRDSNPLPAWRYVKLVPFVPFVPTFQNNSSKTENKTINVFNRENKVQKSGTNGTNGTKEENLIASHCKKWRTGACSLPGDPNCVVPTNPCPKTCPDYEEQEAAAK